VIDDRSPAKSLADRISTGGYDVTKKEKGDELDKASSITTTATATTATEEKPEEEDLKEQDTNLVQNRYEVAVKLQDLQADPNSPLYSVKSFEALGLSKHLSPYHVDNVRHPNLLKGIYAMKFQKPSKVQERALPLLVSNPYHYVSNKNIVSNQG
jgi:ATP-dependent RNA helicase DDX19/DBP5